jgi:hypothetical protein
VYRWEQSVIRPEDKVYLSREECRALVERVFSDYNYYGFEPDVIFRGTSRTRATGSRNRISLPPWAMRVSVVLHEVAHALGDRRLVSAHAWHGPEFVRLYCELLSRYSEFGHAASGLRAERINVQTKVWYEEVYYQ